MADDVDKIVEGLRVICDGQYGTVQFFGVIPPATGLWYGIEWDDDGRGKHSGEHEGVKYFECSRPGSGSFVRESKLEFGVSYVEALMSKFNDLHHREETEDLEFFYCIGEDKLHVVEDKLQQLKYVNLRSTNVSRAGNEKSFGNITPNIVELDLSKTLLSDWNEVLKIVKVLPQLMKLDVSETRLNSVLKRLDADGYPTDDVKLPLKTLVVNKANLDWQQVLAISSLFGNLEELYACFNKIQSLKGGDLKRLGKLQKLNLEGNDLSDWNDILLLQVLPFLDTLVLNDTKLDIVSFPGDVSEASDVFSNLKSLSLSQTMISSWSSTNQMNRLLSLRKLTFKRCPLVKDIPEYEARQELIVRLEKSSKLNQSDVTVKERQAAERAYLKKYGKEWLAAGGSPENQGKVDMGFKVKHPRYLSLLKTHDVPEGLGLMASLGSTLKDNLVVVTIACVNDPEKKPIIKKLPRTMTVSKLKGLLQWRFKVPSVSQMLSYVDQSGHEVDMDDNLRTLSFYSVESNDTINVRW